MKKKNAYLKIRKKFKYFLFLFTSSFSSCICKPYVIVVLYYEPMEHTDWFAIWLDCAEEMMVMLMMMAATAMAGKQRVREWKNSIAYIGTRLTFS